jgi:hypothetical protein
LLREARIISDFDWVPLFRLGLVCISPRESADKAVRSRDIITASLSSITSHHVHRIIRHSNVFEEIRGKMWK